MPSQTRGPASSWQRPSSPNDAAHFICAQQCRARGRHARGVIGGRQGGIGGNAVPPCPPDRDQTSRSINPISVLHAPPAASHAIADTRTCSIMATAEPLQRRRPFHRHREKSRPRAACEGVIGGCQGGIGGNAIPPCPPDEIHLGLRGAKKGCALRFAPGCFARRTRGAVQCPLFPHEAAGFHARGRLAGG
jgi:hypothetical protein